MGEVELKACQRCINQENLDTTGNFLFGECAFCHVYKQVKVVLKEEVKEERKLTAVICPLCKGEFEIEAIAAVRVVIEWRTTGG